MSGWRPDGRTDSRSEDAAAWVRCRTRGQRTGSPSHISLPTASTVHTAQPQWQTRVKTHHRAASAHTNTAEVRLPAGRQCLGCVAFVDVNYERRWRPGAWAIQRLYLLGRSRRPVRRRPHCGPNCVVRCGLVWSSVDWCGPVWSHAVPVESDRPLACSPHLCGGDGCPDRVRWVGDGAARFIPGTEPVRGPPWRQRSCTRHMT